MNAFRRDVTEPGILSRQNARQSSGRHAEPEAYPRQTTD
jgi:hypothetical protein